jgi:hypothetical protein
MIIVAQYIENLVKVCCYQKFLILHCYLSTITHKGNDYHGRFVF